MERAGRRVPFGVWVAAFMEVVLSTILLLDATGIRPSNSSSIVAALGGEGGILSWGIAGLAVIGLASAVALARL